MEVLDDWAAEKKSKSKHHRQEGIYIFYIINCIGIKEALEAKEKQNPNIQKERHKIMIMNRRLILSFFIMLNIQCKIKGN